MVEKKKGKQQKKKAEAAVLSHSDVKAYLGRPDVVDRAEKCQILWARVGSYPMWPAQMMVEEAVDFTALPKSKKRDPSMYPIMFFGDCARVAWVKEKSLMRWGEGVERGCMDKGSVSAALMELHMFMTYRSDGACCAKASGGVEMVGETYEAGETDGEEARCIKGWWCVGPEEVPYPWPHPEDDDEDGVCGENGGMEASRPSVDRLPKASIVNGRLKLSEAKRERLVKSFGGDAFSGKNAFPEYVHVSRNAWTVPRPRQLKADEIEVCNCYPMPMSVDSKRRLGMKMDGKSAASSGAKGEDEDTPNASPKLIGCGHGCLNRTSFMHCAPKTCPCGDLCTNKPFYKLETPKLEMILTKNKGWGVQAAEPIERGTFVVEYAGEVIDDAEMSRRMAESRAQGHHHFYMMEMSSGLVIDAMYKGNVARLLNSSCAPNCETQKWHDAATGEVRVGIFALRNIRAGEELCYDYNFEHIIDDSGAKYSCQCGAPNCRGSIDTKLRLSTKDEGRRIEIWWEGDKVYYPGVHAKYDVRRGMSGTSRIVYDDGHVEWILLNEHEYRWLDEGKTLKRRRNAAMIVGQAPEENVGSRIDVWWDEDHCYYPGRMTAYDADRGLASISYDDGIREELKLCEHEYRWITDSEYQQGPINDSDPQDIGATDAADKLESEKSVDPSGSDTQVVIFDASGGEAYGEEEEGSELEEGENQGGGNGSGRESGSAVVKEAFRGFFESCTAAELQHVASRFHSQPDMDTGLSDDHVDPDGAETENARTTCARLFEAVLGAPAGARQAVSSTIRRVLGQALESYHATGTPVPQLFEPPLNPGAEQTAGSLHGNGRGGAGMSGGREASVSSRGRKRQKKVFGTDFEQEDDAGRHNNPKSQRGSLSPVRQRPKTAPKLPPTSPGIEAASMLAQMAHSKVATVEPKPRSKARSAFRGCGPTPPSTGLPKRTILVAKRLTNSDVTKGRVLLPRAAVESNLSFAVGRAHSLVAKDHEGNTWEFTLQSWANGIESRRVFVLEHAGEYIKYHVLKIEDVIGISTTEEGEFMIEFNTDEVCAAAESQQAARAGGQSAVNKSLPAIRPGSINPLVKHNSGRCNRSVHCNKPAGHPGFCMRTPASNKGKKAGGRGRGRGPVSRGRGKQIPSLHRRYLRGDYEDWDDDDEDTQDSGPDSQPNSARHGRGDSDDEIFRRGGTLTPRFPTHDYFGNSKSEFGEAYGNDGVVCDGGDGGPGVGGGHAVDKTRAPLPKYPAAGGPLPLPPELGPGVPPIFIGAPDSVPQYPPQLRSPLRPQVKPILANQQDASLAAGGQTQQHLKSVPHMGLKDDMIDGMSPHAFHGQRNDWNVFEGYSPTVAKFDPHKQAPFSGGMPAAPLPLFGGAPPPLIRTGKPGSKTGTKEGVTTPRGTKS